MKYKVTLNGRTYEVEVEAGKAMLLDEYEAIVPTAAPAAPAAAPAPAAPAAVAAGETAVNSPMPGNIFKVECKVGDTVKAGDTLVVLEAMKMEIEVSAPVDGTVKSVSAVVGTAVNTDDLLVTLG